MGENCEAKLFHWKNEIEKVKSGVLLLKEVERKQVGNHDDEEMRVDVDFSENTVQSYKFYTPSAFRCCEEQLYIDGCDLNALTDLDLTAASKKNCPDEAPSLQVISVNRLQRLSRSFQNNFSNYISRV